MSPPGKIAVLDEPQVRTADEPDDRTNRNRMLWIAAFVAVSVGVCLLVYLLFRPPNRHLEPTPYDNLISQLRKNMSEEDVLALFRSASDGTGRAEFGAYDEPSASGKLRVISYRIGSDEPLTVRLRDSGGRTVQEWCYRDHCHDNIE